MNVYKVSWVAKGQPNSLIAVANTPHEVSAHVKALDESSNVEAVATLYTDVHVFAEQANAKPEPPKPPRREPEPTHTYIKKK